jgi:glycosyltransferase involved in cell wall biosynthesis
MPKVSIIIPNYNQTKFLREAIQSALNQTYKSFEIIVVDDGSSDNCREMVDEFGEQVRYRWQENKGLGGARNTGIRAAQGELIGLLDADDMWKPTFLEKMVYLASQNPDAGVYYCSAQAIDENGHKLPQVFGSPARPPETLYWTLLRSNFIIPSTILMRRSIVINAGLFDRSFRSCEDWDLWLRLLPDCKFVGTSDCLVKYRIHGESLSADSNKMQQAYRAVVEKHFGSEEGDPTKWSDEKKRTYGGVYRYNAITSFQSLSSYQSTAENLRRGLIIDPTLSIDLDLFFNLAIGNQIVRYNATVGHIDIERNAISISSLLTDVFSPPLPENLATLRQQTEGTANFALGLVAYNSGQRKLSRRFFLTALKNRRELFHNKLILSDLLKSFLSQSLFDRIKEYAN